MKKVLVIGGGYAGSRAVALLARERGIAATLVTAEDRRPYCQHLLPELVAGRKEPADLALPDFDDVPDGSVRIVAGARVAKLVPGERKAVVEGGGELPYDAAVVACGARVWIPANLREAVGTYENVFALKRMADALGLRREILRGARRIAVIGAGRVGLLLAEALRGSPVEVTITDIAAQILPTMLHADVAARVRRSFEGREGLAIRTGVPVRTIDGEGGRARRIVTEDGGAVACDAVVVATGVEGDAVFLSDHFPDFREGLPVNARMETGLDGIYAAGDAVRFATAAGTVEPGQLVVNARAQAETAVEAICGRPASCPPLFIGNVLKAGDAIAARVGAIDVPDREDLRIGRSFARISLDGGSVVGLQFAGDPEDLRGLCTLVPKRFPRVEIEDALRGGMRLCVPSFVAAQGTRWA